MTNNSTEEEFIKGLKSQDTVIDDSNILGDAPIKTEAEPEKEEGNDSPRNRRERRFVREMEQIRQKAQEDREARIKAEERAAALLELGRRADSSSDPDEMKFYGDTPEGKFAKAFMEKKLKETEERAYTRALEEIRQEQEAVSEEEQKDSQTIDSGFAQVEDEFDVDLSGDTAESKKLRNSYIDFLEGLTTNDFPDFVESFKVFQQLNTKPPREATQRQKQLADRSMAGQGNASAPQERKFRSGREYIDYLQQINNS
jgi:hypothetical protein